MSVTIEPIALFVRDISGSGFLPASDILFRQITTFIKVRVAFVFGF